MNNGCICCTVRGDLVRILGEIEQQRTAGELDFEHVIIETTGLADPAPVAQTFFVDDAVAAAYRLDAVVTVVDAKHAMRQLDENHEAQEQVGFADRILVSKTDLVSEDDYSQLMERLRGMNRRATIQRAHPGQTDLFELLDVRGFNLEDILEIEPDFLEDVSHEHDDEVKSFVIRETRPYDSNRLNAVLDVLATTLGEELLRYKGILNIYGNTQKIVLQGVHMIMGGTELRPWREDETRENVLVFIGRNLPEDSIRRMFQTCVTEND